MKITYPLMLMIIYTLLSVIIGNIKLIGISVSDITVNPVATNSSFYIDVSGYEFNTSGLILGAITVLITIVAVAVGTGISVLGTGLSSESVGVVIKVVSYIAIWSLLTVFSFPLIVSIVVFGFVIYLGITFLYAIAVIQKF